MTTHTPRKWSQHVTETSDALDLPHDLFRQADPRQIAEGLKRSAEHSERRKSSPYRSAMSMLVFYINRAGHKLPAAQKRHLEDAKDALRALFGRPAGSPRRAQRTKKPASSASRHRKAAASAGHRIHHHGGHAAP
ncbi:MAG TPA: DUF3175 domain-containing protein [Burkholderiaceae bacterium]